MAEVILTSLGTDLGGDNDEFLPSWLVLLESEMDDEFLPSWLVLLESEQKLMASLTPVTRGLRNLEFGETDGDEDMTFTIPANSSRGVRNNNPGNVETGTKWQGIATDEELNPAQRKENRFVVFNSPEFGIRSIAKIIQTYRTKHGLTTIRGIINRWAPPSENNTDAYVNAVAEFVGVGPDDRINTRDPKVLLPLVSAIIKHENGVQPYPESTLLAGISLAFPRKEA